ncbi:MULTISPECIES: hypothetical protein [Bacillus]|uniref:Uncharacterized protein n=1 Tax=Bacillus cereus TaxID=1396 RepID=A0A161TNT3_BACCE|nr:MULTISPECIES: hypothetical protein [Bacillus]KZD54557.1 hypothetical protein B4088_5660 [Bacillus cereus]TSI10026.1 hypothetical protein FOT98_23550 [Bacillus sp. HY001]
MTNYAEDILNEEKTGQEVKTSKPKKKKFKHNKFFGRLWLGLAIIDIVTMCITQNWSSYSIPMLELLISSLCFTINREEEMNDIADEIIERQDKVIQNQKTIIECQKKIGFHQN